MANCDIVVLLGSLTVLTVSFVWPRAFIVGPVLFAWAGAAFGGIIACVRHYDRSYDQVGIEYIVLYAGFGVIWSWFPGFAVFDAYRRGSRRRKVILEAYSAASLFAGFGVVVGWNIHRRGDAAEWFAVGYSVMCAMIGAALALLNGRIWRCRADLPIGN